MAKGFFGSLFGGGSKKKKSSPRPKSAANKDHKYYNADESHEAKYAKAHGRKKKTYKK